jgi:formate dehydrogenase subunit beta
MKSSTLKLVNANLLETFNEFFKSLFEKKIIDALLVPQETSLGTSCAHTLIKDPSQIRRANPIAPILLVNAARLVSELTVWNPGQKIGVVLRSCEIRALIELVKFQQATLDELVVIGVDCLGTFEPTDYKEMMEKSKGSIMGDFINGKLFEKGYRLRTACQVCERPVPEGTHLAIGILGVDTKKELLLQASDELWGKLGLQEKKGSALRERAVTELISERSKRNQELLKESHERFGKLENLLSEFISCKRCYNCQAECPICYCKQCIFLTPVFEHKPDQYLNWAQRKGAIKLPYETILYHLTRLNHMVTSCVNCGQCSSACPNKLPVFELFHLMGQDVQKVFKYVPGRDVEEEPPVVTFKEEELEPL